MINGKTKRPVFFAKLEVTLTKPLDHSRPEKNEVKVPSKWYWNPGSK